MPSSPISAARAALVALAGDWEGTEHLGASPWTSAGTAHGAHRLRASIGDQILVHDYEQRRDGAATLTGHGVLAVEPESADVLWWWFDDYGHPPLAPSRGSFADDGSLVLVKATPRGRQRASFAVSGDILVHRIEVAPSGEEALTTIVEASYARRR
jgi:hypothetical protein